MSNRWIDYIINHFSDETGVATRAKAEINEMRDELCRLRGLLEEIRASKPVTWGWNGRITRELGDQETYHPVVEIPKKGAIVWYFDRMILSKPVKVKFLEVNSSDGWWRYKFVDNDHAILGDFISHPPSEWGRTFCPTKQSCILAAVKCLLEKTSES
ncbi:MAG: hypothetical protein WC390_10340 [Sulfurimonas sp.]|jgi:hypothetical protein